MPKRVPRIDLSSPKMSVHQLSKKIKRTPQAIYLAIRTGRLIATKDDAYHWFITPRDAINYFKQAYDRKFSHDEEGNKLFDPEKNIYSIAQLSQLSGISKQRIYYLIRRNFIPYEKCRSQYILKIESIRHFTNKVKTYNPWEKKDLL